MLGLCTVVLLTTALDSAFRSIHIGAQSSAQAPASAHVSVVTESQQILVDFPTPESTHLSEAIKAQQTRAALSRTHALEGI